MTDITKLTAKELIDFKLLAEFYGYMNADIEARFKAIADRIGTVPATVGEGDDEQPVINVIDFIQKSVALVNKDAVALTKRVEANEQEVSVKLPAYITASVANAIAEVLGEDLAETDPKTLAKVAEWIAAHKLTFKQMQDAVKAAAGTDGKTQTAETLSVPGVKLFIDSLVNGKNVSTEVAEGELLLTIADDGENHITVGTTAKMQQAIALAETSVQEVKEGDSDKTLMQFGVSTEGKAVKVSNSDAKVAEALAEVKQNIQGDTDETLETVDAKAETIQLATSNQVRAIFGLDPIAE